MYHGDILWHKQDLRNTGDRWRLNRRYNFSTTYFEVKLSRSMQNATLNKVDMSAKFTRRVGEIWVNFDRQVTFVAGFILVKGIPSSRSLSTYSYATQP